MKIDYRKKCKACGRTGKASACIIFSYVWDEGRETWMLRKVVTYRKGFTLEI